MSDRTGFKSMNAWVLALLAVLGLWAAAPSGYAEEESGSESHQEKKNGKEKGKSESPPAPTVTTKTGEPLHDYIVAFEKVYAEALAAFEVAKDVKHDYAECEKHARQLEETAQAVVSVHEDRLRQFGNEYHHQLELLATNAHRLRVAVAEHHRTDIFTYWAQLKLVRDALAKTAPWR